MSMTVQCLTSLKKTLITRFAVALGAHSRTSVFLCENEQS